MLPDFRVRQRDYLLEISRVITEELELNLVLTRIVRVSAELLAGHAGIIALRDEGGWRIASSYGINAEFLKNLEPLLADIPDQGDPARFALPEINRRLQRITAATSMGLLTGVGLPMIAHSEIVGVIFVFRSYPGRFSMRIGSCCRHSPRKPRLRSTMQGFIRNSRSKNSTSMRSSNPPRMVSLFSTRVSVSFVSIVPARVSQDTNPRKQSGNPTRRSSAGCGASLVYPWKRLKPAAGRFRPKPCFTSKGI